MSKPNLNRILSQIPFKAIQQTYEECPEQVNAICEGWNLLAEGKSFEAGKLLLEYHLARKTCKLEPLLSTLHLRIARAQIDQYPNDELLTAMAEGDAALAAIDVWNSITIVEMAFVNDFGHVKENAVASTFFHLELILQFALFHALHRNQTEKIGIPALQRDWKNHRFSELFDYSGIDPVLLELCPPHFMWERYLIDETVHELQDDGTVKEIPLSQYDIKNAPLGGLRMNRENEN